MSETTDKPATWTEAIVGWAAMLYAYPALGFMLYFNWKFANEHGFFAWFFLGEIWSCFKGALWPIFLFIG